jgi:ribose transport system substrate-binding protein
MKRFAIAAGVLAGFAFGSPAMAQTKPSIPIIVKNTTSPYWQTVLAGARKAGQDLGVEIVELGAKSESDVAGQVGILGKAAASKPSAIVIAPVEFAALGKAIDEAAKTSKIIGIDTTADTKALTSFVATNEVEAGRLAADALAKAITRTYADAEGDIAVITATTATQNQSAAGFKLQIADKYRALNLLSERIADAQPEAGLSIVKELVETDRDLRGVFVSNVTMADGATQVVYNKSSGDRINYIVFGSDEKLLKSLDDGTIAALVVPDPFRIGYEGIKTAFAASKGEKVPATVDVAANLITKANLDSARSRELLNSRTQ